MSQAPPHNLDAERGVLGTVLLSVRALEPLLVEDGLRPGHFYRECHEIIFAAMVALYDEGRPVDALTVVDHLERTAKLATVGGAGEVHGLVGAAEAPGNVRHYARIVVDLAAWRTRLTAAYEIQAAVAGRDEDAFINAERMLAQPVRPDDTTSSPEELAHMVVDYLASKDEPGISTPFEQLTRFLNGGFRRGAVTVIAAWTSMGKTVLGCDVLKHAAHRGYRAHAYTNEMSREEYSLRILADLSGVKFSRLMAKELDQAQADQVLRAAPNIPFGITDCAGWLADDVARHIRRHRWDIWVVDLFNRFPARDTAGWDHVAAVLNVVALQSNSHGVVLCQLNHERDKQAVKPRPVLRDIRNTGMLADNSANVLFVHLDQEEIVDASGGGTGIYEKLPDGQVYLEKARNGRLGGLKVRLNHDRMRFERVAA